MTQLLEVIAGGLSLGVVYALIALGFGVIFKATGVLNFAHGSLLLLGAYTVATVASKAGLLVGLLAGVAVAAAGLCGGLFSPVSARLRGLYLGVASLGLVFLGQYLLTTLTTVTGGYNGRFVPPLNLFGLELSDRSGVEVLGVPFGRLELLWILTALLATAAYLVTRRIVGGRPGLALRLLRESEIAAASMGVDVNRYKATVFVVSSMYAGLAGVLFAVCIQRIVPESFGLPMSVTYLAAIVIGGMRSPAGAVAGAVFVTSLPLLQHYAVELPFLAAPGREGLSGVELSSYAYGALIVAVLVLWPGGLVRLAAGVPRPGRRAAVPEVTGSTVATVSPADGPARPEVEEGTAAEKAAKAEVSEGRWS